MENVSKEYAAAYERHNIAIAAYEVARDKFRAMEIGYEEFAIAQKAKRLADAEFDLAFAQEQGIK